MRHRFNRDNFIFLGRLALEELSDLSIGLNSKVRRFNKSPRQVFIPVLPVALAFLLEIAHLLRPHAPAVRSSRDGVKSLHSTFAIACREIFQNN